MTLGIASDAATALLKQSGVSDQVQTALAQAGIPPEALSVLGQGAKIFSGKGSLDDKLAAGAKFAQSLIQQIGGPAAQIGSFATAPVMKFLGIEQSAVGSIAGTAGTAVGTAVLGPLGGAVGGFVSETVVGGIKDLVSTSPAEREVVRRNDDIKRINAFAAGHGLAPLDSSHHWKRDLNKWYALFRDGRIIISQGKAGGATTKWWFRNGKLEKVSDGEYGKIRPQWINPNPKNLVITSASMSGRFLLAITPIEAKALQLHQVAEALLRAQRVVADQKKKQSTEEQRLSKLFDQKTAALTKKIDQLVKQQKTAPAKKAPAKKPAASTLTTEQKQYEKWLLS